MLPGTMKSCLHLAEIQPIILPSRDFDHLDYRKGLKAHIDVSAPTIVTYIDTLVHSA